MVRIDGAGACDHLHRASMLGGLATPLHSPLLRGEQHVPVVRRCGRSARHRPGGAATGAAPSLWRALGHAATLAPRRSTCHRPRRRRRAASNSGRLLQHPPGLSGTAAFRLASTWAPCHTGNASVCKGLEATPACRQAQATARSTDRPRPQHPQRSFFRSLSFATYGVRAAPPPDLPD